MTRDIRGLVVALAPYYLARGVRERSRTLRIWAGRGYALFLKRYGPRYVEYREYTTTVKGRQYRRGLIIVRGWPVTMLKRLTRRGFKRLVRHYRDVFVESLLRYRPRLDIHALLKRMYRVLTKKLAHTLLDEAVKRDWSWRSYYPRKTLLRDYYMVRHGRRRAMAYRRGFEWSWPLSL